jgi:hypothetical protein
MGAGETLPVRMISGVDRHYGVTRDELDTSMMALTEIPQVCASNFLTCEAWSR